MNQNLLDLNLRFKIKLRVGKSRKLSKMTMMNELIVKNCPESEKQPIQQQPKFKQPDCPSCKRKNWLKIDKGTFCQNCEYSINKQKHQIDKKVLRQDHYF